MRLQFLAFASVALVSVANAQSPMIAPAVSPDVALATATQALIAAYPTKDCAAAAAAFHTAAPQAGFSALGTARATLTRTAPQASAECELALRGAFGDIRHALDVVDTRSRTEAGSVGQALEEYFGMAGFEFEPGDVVLLRGSEAVSSAVSQIGQAPTFFSHVAIIGMDPKWKTPEVVESVVDDGLRVVPLEEWLDAGFVRVAVYRYRDSAVAERAAIAAWEDATSRRGKALEYDFNLALDDTAREYCTELVRHAYRAADPKAEPVPLRPSNVGSLLHAFPLDALGMPQPEVFLPDDLELDPRFMPMVELRDPRLIPAGEAMDGAFFKIYQELRGPERDKLMAEVDAKAPTGMEAFAALFSGQYKTYKRLPENVRTRLAGLARVVAERLKAANIAMPVPETKKGKPAKKKKAKKLEGGYDDGGDE